MLRVTSSGFSPRRIRTTPPHTSLPSFSRMPRRGPGPRVTVATSPTRRRAPPELAIGACSRSRTAFWRSKGASSPPGAWPSHPTPRTRNSPLAFATTWPPTASFERATAQNVRQGHAEGPQTVWVQFDLVLDGVAAHGGDLRHAGHRLESRPNIPVLQRTQLPRVLIWAFDRVPEDLASRACVRGKRRHPRRQRDTW